MEAPTNPSQNVRTCRQPERKAIDSHLFLAIYQTANLAIVVNAIHVAIFAAGILGSHLVFRAHAPEMPVNIIRRPKIISHACILQRNYEFSRGEFSKNLHCDVFQPEQ
jgi:hypothetical protein